MVETQTKYWDVYHLLSGDSDFAGPSTVGYAQKLEYPLVNCYITMENHHLLMGRSTINNHN
jgi:hypothetical protein